jgi:hypothetical protein
MRTLTSPRETSLVGGASVDAGADVNGWSDTFGVDDATTLAVVVVGPGEVVFSPGPEPEHAAHAAATMLTIANRPYRRIAKERRAGRSNSTRVPAPVLGPVPYGRDG